MNSWTKQPVAHAKTLKQQHLSHSHPYTSSLVCNRFPRWPAKGSMGGRYLSLFMPFLFMGDVCFSSGRLFELHILGPPSLPRQPDSPNFLIKELDGPIMVNSFCSDRWNTEWTKVLQSSFPVWNWKTLCEHMWNDSPMVMVSGPLG